MIIEVVTLFPAMVEQCASHSIIGRARESGALQLRVVDLRDYTHDRHRTADDAPYGGGAGMVMKVQPLDEAITDLRQKAGEPVRVILMSPQGRKLDQRLVEELAGEGHLVLICGHYEGVDERVREHLVDDEISIGDYVLTGGELPALVLVDAVARYIPGVLGKAESAEEESFRDGLLEYPQYTRPEEYRGWRVPEVLLSGHHAMIARWRRRESLRRTLERRPDLLASARLTRDDLQMLEELGADGALLEKLKAERP
ncbi:MAG: tRNA (guanosine(37)-N1)-methyltransferase TrmD [Armatimonadota bacterium]|jgi:tRNA (guanine37-N1)-methyltransferase